MKLSRTLRADVWERVVLGLIGESFEHAQDLVGILSLSFLFLLPFPPPGPHLCVCKVRCGVLMSTPPGSRCVLELLRG